MSNEEDYLATEKENLEEVLVEVPSEPISTDCHDNISRQLDFALESISTLSLLKSTIEHEGVSIHDVRALNKTRQDLMEKGFNLNKTSSVEDYEKLFTPSRSSLNIRVSNEGIIDTIISTIKEWVRLLLSYIVKAIRWYKSSQMTFDTLNSKIQTMNITISKLKDLFETHLAFYDNSDYGDLSDIAIGLLRDPKLPKSNLTLIAFGDKVLNNKLITYKTNIINRGKTLLAEIIEVREVVEGKIDPNTLVASSGLKIEDEVSALETFVSSSDDPDFLIKSKSVGQDFYKDIRNVVTRRAIGYEFIYNLYTSFADELKKIQRFGLKNVNNNLDILTDRINSVNKSIESLDKVIAIFQQLGVIQYKVTGTYVNFYIKAISHLSENGSKGASFTDIKKTTADSLNKKFRDVLKDIGL